MSTDLPLPIRIVRRPIHDVDVDALNSILDADDFVLASQVGRSGDKAAFYRAVRAGRFRRLARGVYLPAALWDRMSPDDRYLAQIRAVALEYDGSLVFSHRSAAALWRLPMVGSWPFRPEVVTERSSGGRSRRGFAAHGDGLPDLTDMIDGVRVTSLPRTVVDIGRTAMLGTAVVMADHALATANGRGSTIERTTPAELASTLDEHPSARGRAKCLRVLSLATGLSGSPGESVSRVGMHLLGLPMPILQQEFVDDVGRMFADFWWPQFNLVGEFDGRGKYLRHELMNGLTTGEVLLKEKDREDRLRALGPGVVRWGWDVAMSLTRLEAKLRRAGLR